MVWDVIFEVVFNFMTDSYKKESKVIWINFSFIYALLYPFNKRWFFHPILRGYALLVSSS